MRKPQLMSQATMPGSGDCKVLYNQSSDTVEIAVGSTSLRFEAKNFMMMSEMMRKATAKLVMQTELSQAL